MVRKLLKYDLFAIWRAAGCFAIVLLGVAVITRITTAVDTEGTLSVLMAMLYMYALIAMFISVFVLTVQRFYKALYKSEGYFSLSLPMTADQMIWSKLFSALVSELFALVIGAASLGILLIGQDLAGFEIVWQSVKSILGLFVDFRSLLFSVESILKCLTELPLGILSIFAILSVAQLFARHRIGKAFLIGFGVYMVSAIIDSVVFIPLSNIQVVDSDIVLHLSSWIQIVINLIIDVGCYLLVRYILRNKVNLLV